jgi:murein DD-endopeptidase MepM/ murein hydrolase activator NlpD
MGTAALSRQHISRRPPVVALPAPRRARRVRGERSRPIARPLLLAGRPGVGATRRRFRLPAGLVFPVAGLLLSIAVVPAVGSRPDKHPPLTSTPTSETAPTTETALASYLLSEPIRKVEPGALPNTLRVGTYRVRQGETLSAIAQRHGLAVDTLISFNNIKRARSLSAGTELRVPSADGLSYTVRGGDSLRAIAGRYGVSFEKLLDWNNLQSDTISAGQALFLPGARLPASVRDSVLGKLMIFPTRGELSSRFGWRQNPFTGMREHHNGLDIGAPIGTPVGAAASGRVAAVGVSPVYGRYVILSHADGLQTLYGHLNRVLTTRGASVAQGEQIGEVGNTGYSTGAHLHFTVFRRGVPVDPLSFFE